MDVEGEEEEEDEEDDDDETKDCFRIFLVPEMASAYREKRVERINCQQAGSLDKGEEGEGVGEDGEGEEEGD